MYNTDHRTIRLPAADYIRRFRDSERFIEYCRACENYGSLWVCPPYGSDPCEQIAGYRYIHIIAVRIRPDDALRHSAADTAELHEATLRVIAPVRRLMDRRLLELEKQYPGSRAFFAGSCLLCRKQECGRRSGKRCIHPEEARPSLEAYGFDIAATASRLFGITLRWSEQLTMPEYFTLVGGLFTDREIADTQWNGM